MWLTDIVWCLGEEQQESLKISPEMIEYIKYRIKNIIANVGVEEFKKCCMAEGFHLSDKWFEEINK
jgi:hypothetical protein